MSTPTISTTRDYATAPIRRFGRINWLGLRTLVTREIMRFMAVWQQTIFAPLMTSALFVVVFALALGQNRGEVMGLPYLAFLGPGILMMTVIQTAFANSSSSLISSKMQGNIVDTIVNGLSAPLAHLPVTLSALGMLAVQTALHVPVPSGSGQATLTMPLFAPLADLIGLSRQVAVLAFQYGAGLCELITPTNGTLMAMLAACGLRFDQWLRFAAPLYGLLLALGVGSVVLAIALGI